MKKLLFATALVASAAAFADPLNAISFEGYTADNGTKVGNAADVGGATAGMYFYYQGDEDGSTVKAFGVGDNLAAPSITRPLYFASASPNANYLELSTEGGILWRSINTLQSDTSGETPTYDLGEAKPVAATGTYFDSLVQFTPTEDGGAPELDGADKLAIWLNVDGNSVTNLMVRAGFVDDNGTDTTQTPTTYTLTTASPVVPGQWYRLTVKTIADVTQQVAKNPLAYEAGYTGFEIYLDGVLLAATAPAFGEGFIDLATDAGEFGWLDQTDDASLITYLQSGTVFPALGLPTTTYTLQGVGFKGSGAIDDIVWTEEDPFAGGTGGDDAWIATVTEIFDGANLDAAEKAKITAWASGNSIVVDTTVEGQAEIAAAAYLLGLDELPGAIPELTITAIEEGEDANHNPAWILTVAASVTTSGTTTDLELPTTINGAITLTQAGTLAGLATATPTTTGFTATVDETVTVTVPKTQAAAAFMKVGVGIAPAANNAQQE